MKMSEFDCSIRSMDSNINEYQHGFKKRNQLFNIDLFSSTLVRSKYLIVR